MRGRMSWGAHIQLTHCCLGCLVHGRPPDSSLFIPESNHCPVPRSWLHSGLVSSSPPPNIGWCRGGGGESLADTLGWGLSPHLIAMWCEKWITESRRWPWVTLCVSPAGCWTAVALYYLFEEAHQSTWFRDIRSCFFSSRNFPLPKLLPCYWKKSHQNQSKTPQNWVKVV